MPDTPDKIENADAPPAAEMIVVQDALAIDAPAMLEKAACCLRNGAVSLGIFLCHQATRKMGLMHAEERPEELGRAMLDAMGPPARGIVLREYIAERARQLAAGVPEMEAGERAARRVADALGMLYIAPEHFSAVLFARRWWLMEWLPLKAWKALDAIMARERLSCEDVLTRALCAMLDNSAAPAPAS